MKTTNKTQQELTQMKRANTIELKQWQERLEEIMDSEASQMSRPEHQRYFHGECLWMQRDEAIREIEYCQFRIKKFKRMQDEISASS